MLFHLILLFVLLQNVICSFPSYITRCPLPDPNANDCILNSARAALPYVVGALPDYDPIYLNGDILDLTFNNKIELNGFIQSSPDIYLSEVRVDLDSKYWLVEKGGTSITSDFNFVLTIDENDDNILQVKGQITVFQDNWKFRYNGYYKTEEINNQNYMQIDWSWATVSDDTFEKDFIGITTLDNQPITGPELIRVKKALRNFETAFHWKITDIGREAVTLALNTYLKLVPENEIFLPAPVCGANK